MNLFVEPDLDSRDHVLHHSLIRSAEDTEKDELYGTKETLCKRHDPGDTGNCTYFPYLYF